MSEDARACEINQRGLHALPHRVGVLMPEEYMVHSFHQWIRARL
jgi:Rieske 2Fe-2S family protein